MRGKKTKFIIKQSWAIPLPTYTRVDNPASLGLTTWDDILHPAVRPQLFFPVKCVAHSESFWKDCTTFLECLWVGQQLDERCYDVWNPLNIDPKDAVLGLAAFHSGSRQWYAKHKYCPFSASGSSSIKWKQNLSGRLSESKVPLWWMYLMKTGTVTFVLNYPLSELSIQEEYDFLFNLKTGTY